MRTLWACGAIFSVVGLVGCSGVPEEAKGAPPTVTPSAAMLSISGGIDVAFPDADVAPELRTPCTPPPNAKTQLGQEMRVLDDKGTVIGTGKIKGGMTLGHDLFKFCSVDFSFKVPGVSENYQLVIGDFAPLNYTREGIRRGLSYMETEDGALVVQ
ncbi:hypothetical protein [Streptomyces cinereoruber]|uniref:hypothetical protein n=1 Tax=Streptomyces cinereoruber TaxID=67260 RepID=UPI0036480A4D